MFTSHQTLLLMLPQTDTRVQLVTESKSCPACTSSVTLTSSCEVMNVIRMIKLFGWEPRVAQRLADKRESELVFIRKYKILELINNNIKFVSNAPGLLVQ